MFDLENSRDVRFADEPTRHHLGRTVLRCGAVMTLVSLSVGFILICSCDLPFQEPASLALLSLSLAACLAAAWVLFRLRAFLPDSQPILRAVTAVGIVIAVRYVELMLVINGIARLAQRPR